ncbi:uncharacterized protein LOC132644267 [Lycium barbarum]|uniref:uncharacterized protein LOC132644267 n=1 Tax=Lycium barbarum TaxID=112863 RepID=UPI00293E181A|nr:uncharacterized protein LOC132644267 [Lycium barbarum]
MGKIVTIGLHGTNYVILQRKEGWGLEELRKYRRVLLTKDGGDFDRSEPYGQISYLPNIAKGGDISLWWDNWTGQVALALMVETGGANLKLLVKDAKIDGEWAFPELQQLPEYIIELINSIEFGDLDIPDLAIWMSSVSGKFSTKSAWNLLRQSRNNMNIFAKLWHKFLPFKISFQIWRALKRKLPFDDILLRFNISLVSRCHCCFVPQRETLLHTFVNGDCATKVWKFFGAPLGIIWEDVSIIAMLLKWWSAKHFSSVHKEILTVLPLITIWELWKSRCAAKFGEKKMYVSRTVYQILFHLKWILAKYDLNINWASNWPEICNTLMNSRDEFKCTIIKWERPELNWVKLNTDGSKYNDGHIGAGGVIRDYAGHMYMAFAKSLDMGSHNHAEAKAALFGLRMVCIMSF